MSGQLFMDSIKEYGATVLPLDSEHNAIFQCLPQSNDKVSLDGVTQLLLTASGGPFRTFDKESLKTVTPQMACDHPNWNMGPKISVDSATLMNKGLELIEACWLFGVKPDFIEVVVHPQSIIHSMVQYSDGSVLAQLGNPDMRTPIAHALSWPARISSGVESLDFFKLKDLTFEKPDLDRFKCLKLAKEAFNSGSGYCAILNAANEIAVESFLSGSIGFMDIPQVIEQTLNEYNGDKALSLPEILEVDKMGRNLANNVIKQKLN
jgi:1-deoxy-D-xylulose-5-phosphate reductoisomerase